MQDSENKTRNVQLSVREALSSKKDEFHKDAEAEVSDSLDNSDDDENEASFDARMRRQIFRKRTELGDLPPKPKLQNGKHFPEWFSDMNSLSCSGIALCTLICQIFLLVLPLVIDARLLSYYLHWQGVLSQS